MATVNLDHVQFWQPSSKSSYPATKSHPASLHNQQRPTMNCSPQSNSSIALPRGRRPEADMIANRGKSWRILERACLTCYTIAGHIYNLTNSESEAEGDSDNEFPSVEDILYPHSKEQTSVGTRIQGTRGTLDLIVVVSTPLTIHRRASDTC